MCFDNMLKVQPGWIALQCYGFVSPRSLPFLVKSKVNKYKKKWLYICNTRKAIVYCFYGHAT